MQPIQDPQLLSAFVSVAIALVGAIVTLVVARRQWQQRELELKQRTRELELRATETETKQRELESRLEERRQSQHTEVLKARLATYPRLWGVLKKYGPSLLGEQRRRSDKWASDFLAALDECDSEFGVLFSQPVYIAFHTFRGHLFAIAEELAAGETVPLNRYEQLKLILLGNPETGAPGLATQMKNDLGSYTLAALAKQRDA